jgi:hypothetical protein
MGAGPLSADISELMVDIETPEGKTLAIDDPVLIKMLRSDVDEKHQLTLMRIAPGDDRLPSRVDL